MKALARRGGFTLVELLIVVTVLGIATAMVIPSMGSVGVLRVQAAVRTVVSDITQAQSESLAYQRGRAVVFDMEGASWSIAEVNSGIIDLSTDTLWTGMIRGKDFGDAAITLVNFDGDGVLVFDEMGAPVDAPQSTVTAGTGYLDITGSGQTFRVTVEAYTGRVVVTNAAPGSDDEVEE
ncbi:MAG: prepilin-type N-terminal cleavage/methylation domain-containing protein [Phycisphaeraceae bacterium]|nr:prepilin-type N-terminal cleavage/methylation domain-containing protein [Phycisphaerae bacterium]MBX3391143.1 prepilin-type N-terminal cleavage/methylation domain-containing protein [Phycisphaeraceae bacterium]HRJ50388.1 prepilin-type N-terminal cleavage/methylation domain-containing protein [Phycisphaerales bacterium]